VNITATITRSDSYLFVVPGSRGESFQLTELSIDGELVGVEIDGETFDPCKRCGIGGQYSFNGFDSICYDCGGYSHGKSTTEADIVRRYVDRQKAAAKRQAAAEKAAKEQADELAAWVAANADVAEALVVHRSPAQDEYGYVIGHEDDPNYVFTPADRFLTSLADQAAYRALSPKQTDAARTAFARLAERTATRQAANAETVAAGHWGRIGVREDAQVTVASCRFFDNDFGGNWLVTMKTAMGHTLKTWTSGAFIDVALEAEKTGATVNVKATVKSHDTYRDLPETTVTRVSAA
jgi:hypothetical protein